MTFELNRSLHANYSVVGSGRPVILIHGIAASLHDWASMGPALAEHGYRVYALDLLGHGDSAKPDDPNYYRVDSVYQHLAAWIDSLRLDQPALLVGHSLGGYLSILHALDSPERVAALALINPLYTYRQLSPVLKVVRRRPDISAKAMRVAPLWLIDLVLGWDPISSATFNPQARRQIAYDYKRASPYFVHIAGDIPDLTPRLAQVTQPTTVIYGTHDLTLAPGSYPELVSSLPNARPYAIQRCGHQPHIGSPQTVNELVLKFFEQTNPK